MSCIFSISSTENPNSHYPFHFTEKGIESQSRVLPKVNRWKVPEPARKYRNQDWLVVQLFHSLIPLSLGWNKLLSGTQLWDLKYKHVAHSSTEVQSLFCEISKPWNFSLRLLLTQSPWRWENIMQWRNYGNMNQQSQQKDLRKTVTPSGHAALSK